MTTAFQSNAFQTNVLAFQIDVSSTVDTHDGFETDFHKRRKAIERLRAQLAWRSEHPGEPLPDPIVVNAQTMLLAADDPDLQRLLDAYAAKQKRDLTLILMLL